MQNPDTDQLMANYLLGELSEEESARIERRYLADPDFFEELLAVEDDLLDQYARGELLGRQREEFERLRLATPRQRDRLRDAQLLMKRLNAAPVAASLEIEQQRRSLPFFLFDLRKLVLPLAFAALVLLVATSWLALRMMRLQEQVERMRAEQNASEQRQQAPRGQLASEEKAKADLSRQLQEGKVTAGPTGPKYEGSTEKRIEARVATFTLTPNLMRGDDVSSFVLPRGVEIVQLEVQVAGASYKHYDAKVQTADGDLVYQEGGLAAQRAQSGKIIRIKMPTRLLHGRDYIIKISGLSAQGTLEDAGAYSFRILQK
jgi:hypothetical protein